ncbi:Hypothetical predicted protein [Mytilus galloprovincialis]|uniref:CAP-Gly domain-containing protein n=1 Tax=Mytilus galloprovincialis TaxID=29158 RepID=A0A8B6H5A9_MYTGA|nr:Hypothetical predicted protein [Mytilus galloprovincialis]
MVLHQNVNVGQRVEVKVHNRIYRGTVKYKGAIIHKPGDWVGVSLEKPVEDYMLTVGDNDGMLMGRRYFQCNNGHGIFVRANCIRFIPLTRWTYNKYHKVADTAEVDEPLFYSSPKAADPTMISEDMERRVKTGASFGDPFSRAKRYPLTHSVGNRIPAATMTRSMTSLSYTTRPIHAEYDIEDDFISYPSIPRTHMPYSALRNQVKRGWEGAHYVREMSVGTGRDSMKFSQWNDVSP